MNNLDTLYKECQSVAIDYDRLIQFTEGLPLENYKLPNERIFHAHEDQLCWILMTQALSFALWENNEQHWFSQFKGKNHGESDPQIALNALIAHLMESGIPLSDPSFLKNITEDDIKYYFIPPKESVALGRMNIRIAALKELGEALYLNGGAVGLFSLSNNDAFQFVQTIIRCCPSWNDSPTFGQTQMNLQWKSWMAVHRICSAYQHDAERNFENRDIPPIGHFRYTGFFHNLGILKYDLEDALSTGSRQELEMRLCTQIILNHIAHKWQHLDMIGPKTTALLWGLILHNNRKDHPKISSLSYP